jgi:PEP-CTERM motif
MRKLFLIRETLVGNRRYLAFAAAGTLLGMSPLLGASSALAAACATASVSVYEAAGFSCNVGPVTFSDVSVGSTTSGSGVVVLSDFNPFTAVVDGVTEFGLHLSFASDTGTTPGSLADVALTFDVSGASSLTDAFAVFAGTTTGTGTDDLSEVLSNGVSLTLNAPGATSAMFSAIGSLSVVKDQSDFAGSAGSADSSILGNAFSVTAVPEPSTWAMMLAGFVGLGFLGYRKACKGSLAA